MNKEAIGKSIEKFFKKPVKLVKENQGETLLAAGGSFLITEGAAIFLVEKHDYGKSYMGIPVVIVGIAFIAALKLIVDAKHKGNSSHGPKSQE